MDIRILVKNGTVVDGTGAPAYKADVRVAHGRIPDIGADLAAGWSEREFDAIEPCAEVPLAIAAA